MSKQAELPTIGAVVAKATQLREEAERLMASDPYARPYYPTTAGVRQQVKRMQRQLEAEARERTLGEPQEVVEAAVQDARDRAPAATITWMLGKAAATAGEQREANERSERSLRRLTRHRRKADTELAAVRARQTLGQRLDVALAGLATVAAAPAARLGDDRVRGGERDDRLPWAGDPHGYAEERAQGLVQRLEGLLAEARARDVEKAA